MTRSVLDRDVVAEFCRRHRIQRLALFGSVLHGDDRTDSDLDLLVEFEPGVRVGLIGLASMEIELSNMLGRTVDLRTPGELSRYFRDRVLAEGEVQYVRS
jgi:predicted nucleotidyltransferase